MDPCSQRIYLSDRLVEFTHRETSRRHHQVDVADRDEREAAGRGIATTKGDFS